MHSHLRLLLSQLSLHLVSLLSMYRNDSGSVEVDHEGDYRISGNIGDH